MFCEQLPNDVGFVLNLNINAENLMAKSYVRRPILVCA